jgi:hypothetical protein
MQFHSDSRKMIGIYSPERVIQACSVIESAMIDHKRKVCGRRALSRSQARLIAALIALTECSMSEAAELCGMTHSQAITKRRWFTSNMNDQEQSNYFDAVVAAIKTASRAEAGGSR